MLAERAGTADALRTYGDLEASAARLLALQRQPQRSRAEFVQTLVAALDARHSDTRVLAFRIAAILRVEQVPGANPVKLLDALEERIRNERHAIEAIAAKTFVDLSLETLTMLRRIGEAIEREPKKSRHAGLDTLMLPIFERIPVTTRTDYHVYVPEICTGVLSLHNSIMALKPFASTLNNIFTQFDCKLPSFSPGSASYTFLKCQILALHEALNGLVPSKMNSLVFLVVSRFVGLFTSLTSALAAAVFDTTNDSMKREFYALQQSAISTRKVAK
jgi:hypothetical protein